MSASSLTESWNSSSDKVARHPRRRASPRHAVRSTPGTRAGSLPATDPKFSRSWTRSFPRASVSRLGRRQDRQSQVSGPELFRSAEDLSLVDVHAVSPRMTALLFERPGQSSGPVDPVCQMPIGLFLRTVLAWAEPSAPGQYRVESEPGQPSSIRFHAAHYRAIRPGNADFFPTPGKSGPVAGPGAGPRAGPPPGSPGSGPVIVDPAHERRAGTSGSTRCGRRSPGRTASRGRGPG